MSHKPFSAAALSLLLVTALTATGCVTGNGPSLGVFGVPVPVSPYVQDEMELQFHNKERYGRVPILGPLTAGGPTTALDPPSQDEVMQALEKARPIRGNVPFLYEIQRNNVRIVTELISDTIDEPRVFPMVGPAQLHHAHYKCTVYFQEITRVGWPIPYTTRNEDVQEVVYIDHDHLHMVGNVDPGPGAQF